MGSFVLKGFGRPIEAWRVLHEQGASSRFEAQFMQPMVEFIGRDSEITLLFDRWAKARVGIGQAMLLSGDAGIGKSRICQSFRERLSSEQITRVLLQCTPYFSSSSLYPVIEHLERAAITVVDDLPDVRVRKLEQLAVGLPPALLGSLLRLMGLSDGGRSIPGGVSSQDEKVHIREALIELLKTWAEKKPVLLLVEDAHWIDPSTDQLLGQIAERIGKLRVLMLITCRPEYKPAWSNQAHVTRHALARLSHQQCVSLVRARSEIT
ncbi:MAG: hypothetical protein EOP82_00215 [Variovorax sp.]|nr:MAG: hypothetical protein EOP82_00215 [Variovorax sp.]